MITPGKNYVVGIDIGGQTAKMGVIDRRGNVVGETVIPSNKHTDPAEFVPFMAEALKGLFAKLGVEDQILGVGAGAPCANYRSGTIDNAANVTWANGRIVPFANMLSEALDGIPVALTNDANAAALGEMYYGAARGMKDFIVITLGTGVGSGIVIDGKLVYGHDGFAGELGHVRVIRHNGRACGCGSVGCLETYCSAPGIARTARELLETQIDTPSVLRDIDNITAKDVQEAAFAGDAIANQVYAFTGRILGEALANFIAFSSPEAIILFGGVAKARGLLYEPAVKAMNETVCPLWKDKVQLLFSELKDSDAAILGSSAIAWEL